MALVARLSGTPESAASSEDRSAHPAPPVTCRHPSLAKSMGQPGLVTSNRATASLTPSMMTWVSSMDLRCSSKVCLHK